MAEKYNWVLRNNPAPPLKAFYMSQAPHFDGFTYQLSLFPLNWSHYVFAGDRDDTSYGNQSGGSTSITRNGLGASIKRKLREAKNQGLARSISLQRPSSSSGSDSLRTQSRRQTRAFSSGSTTTRPRLVSPESINVPGYAPQAQPVKPQSHYRRAPRRISMADVAVPELLQNGVPMTKISANRQKTFIFQLDPDQGQIRWESKKLKISAFIILSLSSWYQSTPAVPIENIKELRSASDARYYREQFQLAQEYEERWLTIIYIMDGNYKTLHLIASTKDVFQMWDITLRKLYAIRQELMSGLGNVEMRQAVWEKQYWKGSDDGRDQKLDFDETERLCKRLNVDSSTDTLMRLFKVCANCSHARMRCLLHRRKRILRVRALLTLNSFSSLLRCSKFDLSLIGCSRN